MAIDMRPPFDAVLLDTVEADITAFNATRGRRKELCPVLTERRLMGNVRKYGRIISLGSECPEAVSFEDVREAAHQVVPTLLRRKPRPTQMYLDIAYRDNYYGDMQWLIRLMIPRRGRLHEEPNGD